MLWSDLRFHFKQVFVGGYRYLDRCGEFMLAAEREFSCIPKDARPIGGQMEIPELGITIQVDARELAVSQEFPSADANDFFEITDGLAELSEKFFQPSGIHSNGYAKESFIPMTSVEASLKASLALGGDFHSELAKTVGMPAAFKTIDYNFVAGKSELHLTVVPVTFEQKSTISYAAGFRTSELQKEQIDRKNKKNSRRSIQVDHALMMTVDLLELDPPQNALKNHFQRVLAIDKALKESGLKTAPKK